VEADSADIIRSPGTPPDQVGSGPATEADPGRPADHARYVTELFRDHHLELVRLAVLMVSDLATAEDVVQAAFEQLHRRWRSLRRQSSALDYARAAVLNGCRSVLRRRLVAQARVTYRGAGGGRRGRGSDARAANRAHRSVPLAPATPARSELKRATEQVQPEHLRPLRTPVRRHRWRLRLVPVAAAAAVVLIVTVAVLAAGTPAGRRPAAPAASPRSSATIPRYYVTISSYVVPLQAVVRDSADGQVTGAVTVPAVVRPDIATITAAADDRSFIIGTYDIDPAGTMDYRLFRLRISASGRPAPPTELLVIPLPRPATTVGGIALSPDGTKVAISLQYQAASMDSIPYGGIEVVDLATRATRTWIAPRDDYLSWPGQPSWAGGDTMVAFTWWHNTGLAGRISASSTEVRELDTAVAGTDLLDSRVIVPPAGSATSNPR
jgi:DNA-directed RNA polymerase specialized sigma24 family protein